MGALYMNSITGEQFGLIMSVITQKRFIDEQLNLKYVMFAATTLLSTMGTFVASIRSKKFEECWNSEGVGEGEGEGESKEEIKEVMELLGNGLNGFEEAAKRHLQKSAIESKMFTELMKGELPAQPDLNKLLYHETDMFNIMKEALRPSDPADPIPIPEPDPELANRIQELIQEGLNFNNDRTNKNRFTELTDKVTNNANENEKFATNIRILLEKVNEAKKKQRVKRDRDRSPDRRYSQESDQDRSPDRRDSQQRDRSPDRKDSQQRDRSPDQRDSQQRDRLSRRREKMELKKASEDAVEATKEILAQLTPPLPCKNDEPSDSDSGQEDPGVGVGGRGGARKRRKTRKHRKRKTKKAKRTRKHKKSLKKKKRKTKKR